MISNNSFEEILKEIKVQYPGVIWLTKKQVASLINRSLSSLNRDIANGTGIPYKKFSGSVLYSIHDIAREMSDKIHTA